MTAFFRVFVVREFLSVRRGEFTSRADNIKSLSNLLKKECGILISLRALFVLWLNCSEGRRRTDGRYVTRYLSYLTYSKCSFSISVVERRKEVSNKELFPRLRKVERLKVIADKERAR